MTRADLISATIVTLFLVFGPGIFASAIHTANPGSRQTITSVNPAPLEIIVFNVTNTNNTGNGSLRQAILLSNANSGGTDTIIFNIPGVGPHVINLSSALPAITDSVVIDGTREPDFTGKPIIVLNGTGAGDVSGLTLNADNITIRGLVINNFSQMGIEINGNKNSIAGNYIGTDVSGMLDQGNGVTGIFLANGAGNNIIGGTTVADRNVVAGNGDDNMKIEASAGSGNKIIGNHIGVDVLGTSVLVNGGSGVDVQANGNRVGGTADGEGNIISGSNYNGIVVSGNNNILQGNYIGTDISGTGELGNGRNGVWITGGNNNLVGGTETGAGNLIYDNERYGVLVSNGTPIGNAILGNSIFGNDWIGIDLSNITAGDDVTSNDANDLDGGPNRLQNFPLLEKAVSIGDHASIKGSYNSGADTTFRIEFFSSNDADPTGYGEGESYLGFTTITTDGSGNATFDIILPDVEVSAGESVAATATTDLGGGTYGNTSEFSAAVPVTLYVPPNDLPCNAIVLSAEDSCSANVFNNMESVDSGIPLTECTGYSGSDVWFKAEVPGSGILVVKLDSGTTPEVPDPEDWLRRPGLAVYSGLCGSLSHDTCWIDPDGDDPVEMPEILITDQTPGDTLHFRIWGYNGSDGFFRICVQEPEIEIFDLSGSGSYCIGETGLQVVLDSSQVDVVYQLQKNGIDSGIPVQGNGERIVWPDQAEGIYQVVATFTGSGLSERMNGKAVVIENPPPVVTFGYGYEKTITIESDSVSGTQDLLNFPVFVSITNDPDLRATSNGGHVEHASGFDIVFTDHEFNPISFERISYDPDSGSYTAWLSVPLLASDADTELRMLYGKAEVTSDLSSVEIWSSEYIQVMHLEDDFTDASFNGNYGENLGTTDTTGVMGRGRSFNGIDNRIVVGDDPSLDGTNDEATLSLWINFKDASDGDHQIIMNTENRYNGGGYEWASQGSGNHFFYPNGNHNDNYNLGPNPFTDETWHYLVATLNYSTLEVIIYVDGIPMSFSTENVPALWTGLAELENWTWGGDPARSSRYFLGLMDEIRVQTVARSVDWLRTEYTNQKDPSAFYNISEEASIAGFNDICMNVMPFELALPKPEGGSFSGTGVAEGLFDPGAAGAGIHAISYIYTDGSGCLGSGSKTQTVLDAPAPFISGNNSLCPNSPAESYSTPHVEGHSYNWVITGADAVITGGQGTNEITVDWGSVNGSLRVSETNDESGCDSTTAEFEVSLVDNTGPSFDCQENITVYLDENCTFSLPDYTTLIPISDACDPEPIFSQSPSADTVFEGIGTIQTVVLTASDKEGNETVCSFSLTVLDNTPPGIIALRDTSVYANEGSYEAYVDVPEPEFLDNCGIDSVDNDFNGGPDASGTYPYGTTTVIYTVTDINGNEAQFNQRITVELENAPDHGLIIPEAFSPNEDGYNDRFEILGIEQYPENELAVFNVHGIEVFRMAAYDNSWNGTTSNMLNDGEKLPSGTYYFVLNLNHESSPVRGFIYLRRE